MAELSRLVAQWLSGLSGGLPQGCPGGWAWALTAIGLGAGLLPTVGAVLVAVLRRRVGSHYNAATALLLVLIGVLAAGVAPAAMLTAAARATATATDAGNLSDVMCLGAAEGEYLAIATVGQTFTGQALDAVALAQAVVLVVGVLFAVGFVAGQARLVLRRGPAWPAKFFWLAVLIVPLVTLGVPVGVAAHVWAGLGAGAFVGVLVALIAGTPSREKVRRSLEPAPGGGGAIGGGGGAGAGANGGDGSRSWGAGGRTRVEQPGGVWPDAAATRDGARGAGAVGADSPAATTRPWADRLAARFAAREPEPPVSAGAASPGVGSDQRSGAATGVGGGTAVWPGAGPPRSHPPTLLDAAPSFPLAASPGPMAAATGALSAAAAGAAARGQRFRLVRRLGSGGFGRVWLAEDARLGHLVALKAAHAPDEETEQRIRREAQALGSIRHPHCVRIHDLLPARADAGLSELDGMVIVMAYVEGPSLGELVRGRGLLDDVAAARVWAGVAGALDAAHARGVMHRDVKPGNVVVDPAGVAHLIDFGIARRTGDATMTLAGFVLGTPDFLAPEVACGERATPASDAWQLAATVSYALTGHPPRGGHPDAVSGLRAAASGAPLSHLPPRSAHLPLLRDALHTDPARRPPLRAVQGVLTGWLHRQGARPDGPVTAVLPGR